MKKVRDTRPRKGDYRVICDASGFKCWRSQCRMQWNGLLVRKDFWEPRHPQDFLRGKVDKQRVSIARPEGEDTFITAADVTPEDL